MATDEAHSNSRSLPESFKYDDYGKPTLQLEDARLHIEAHYDISVERLEEFVSCVDQNFYVCAKCVAETKSEYVLKIMCLKKSRKESVVDGMIECMLYLGIRCNYIPVPVKLNTRGYVSSYKSDRGHHAVYLLKYIKGTTLAEIEETNSDLYLSAGIHLGRIDSLLKDFHHHGFDIGDTVFRTDDVKFLRTCLYLVDSEKRRGIVKAVISAFDERVVPNVEKLREGVIHGDYNPNNVIVAEKDPERVLGMRVDDEQTPHSSEMAYEITGIVDFGDAQHSYYVNEIAIAMVHFMMSCTSRNPFAVANMLLAGYESNFPLLSIEKSVLPVFMVMRLANIAVLGAEQLKTQTSDNEYFRKGVQLCCEYLEEYGPRLIDEGIPTQL